MYTCIFMHVPKGYEECVCVCVCVLMGTKFEFDFSGIRLLCRVCLSVVATFTQWTHSYGEWAGGEAFTPYTPLWGRGGGQGQGWKRVVSCLMSDFR